MNPGHTSRKEIDRMEWKKTSKQREERTKRNRTKRKNDKLKKKGETYVDVAFSARKCVTYLLTVLLTFLLTYSFNYFLTFLLTSGITDLRTYRLTGSRISGVKD